MSNSVSGSTSAFAIYRRLLTYVGPHRWHLAAAVLAMAVYASCSTAFAALMKPMLDGSFVNRDTSAITFVPLMIIVIFICRGASGFFSIYLMSLIGWSVVKRIRQQLFDKYLDLPTAQFDRSSSGEMISRVTFNVQNIATVAADSLTILVRDTLTIFGLLCLMLYHSWKLSLGILVLGPLVALIIHFVSGRFRRLSRGIQDSMGQVASVIEEAVEGQRLVKVFGGRDYEREQFDLVNERNRNLNLKETMTRAASAPVVQFLVAVALAIIVYLASSGTLVGEITVGVFMSFITAMMMLFAPLKQLTMVNAKIQAGIAAGENVFAILDSESERDTGEHVLESDTVELKLHDVSFSYLPDKLVLKQLSFKVAAGETVALVGGSGSGKSTIANLLPRLYDIKEGSITLNGQDTREYTLDSLRRHISYVGQDVTLFNDTVLANIAYGQMRGTSLEKVKAACRIAHANDFIEKLSEGYYTVVGENGVMLSGGQRQRLAIARAILKDAPLLVLDEATSALDTESERKVQQGLAELMRGRTTVVIAHRLSTIENADRIVVMDEGQIVEMGTHQQLLQANGYYSFLQGRGDQATELPVQQSGLSAQQPT
ncbi:lipid A export permease/ATP-binding protein MsbA [Chromatiales bacterium (ex Bugula neritina AB1)]|nr:lipid A export permease/ATP-binding protein MsbA [Chromatiales bacterium (ex Bugula neritina AB1)]